MNTEGLTLIDTHCHLEMPEFDPDREEVLERAKKAGLRAVITIGSDLESALKAESLSQRHKFVYFAAGLHPHDAKDFTEEAFERLKTILKAEKAVAVGETGLDYHYDHSPRAIQRDVFKRHIGLALQSGLPLVVHSREAKEDTISILREGGARKGVLHCFSGDIEMAEAAMAMGLYISMAGPVTFKNASGLRRIAEAVPDDYLLIETDAPYLAPHPMRGKRNEPSFIVHTAGEIARLRGVRAEDIARITTLNAKRLFGIGEMPERGEIAYRIRDSLYLNITNRCTNRCSFCIRQSSDYVKGHRLRLAEEPSAEELVRAIGDPEKYSEVVFCGYGEPLLRLDTVKEVAAWVKERGGRVRLNTNGHGNLIHGRNILPELQGLVDSVSVSLDAHDEKTYEMLCTPTFKGAFEGVISFVREARRHMPEVGVTVVETKGVDVAKARELAKSLGVPLRVRKLHVVG